MARQTSARGASTRPQETSTLLWLGGGALGIAAIIIAMSVLTPSSTDQPTKKPIAPKPQSTAVGESASTTTPPPPAQSVSQNPVRTQEISQRPALTQRPTSEQPVPPKRPQSALAAYFYDIQQQGTDSSAFVQGIMDSEVTWVGYIRSVNNREIGPTLLMAPAPDSNPFDIAYIDFPKGFEQKLAGLAVMDKVRIKGLYRGGGPMPHVDGKSVELVEE